MEKITKEELMEMLNGVTLSDDELEMIAGGGYTTGLSDCLAKCKLTKISTTILKTCVEKCKSLYA